MARDLCVLIEWEKVLHRMLGRLGFADWQMMAAGLLDDA